MRDELPHVVGAVRGDRRAGDGLPGRSVPDEHAAAARTGEDPCPVERERDAQEVDGLGERLARPRSTWRCRRSGRRRSAAVARRVPSAENATDHSAPPDRPRPRPAGSLWSRSHRQAPPSPTATSQRPLGSIAASSTPPTLLVSVSVASPDVGVPEPDRAVARAGDDRRSVGRHEGREHVADRNRFEVGTMSDAASATRALTIACCASARDRLEAGRTLGGEEQRELRARRRERLGLRRERAYEPVLGLGFLVLRLPQRDERHDRRRRGSRGEQRQRREREPAHPPATPSASAAARSSASRAARLASRNAAGSSGSPTSERSRHSSAVASGAPRYSRSGSRACGPTPRRPA